MEILSDKRHARYSKLGLLICDNAAILSPVPMWGLRDASSYHFRISHYLHNNVTKAGSQTDSQIENCSERDVSEDTCDAKYAALEPRSQILMKYTSEYDKF